MGRNREGRKRGRKRGRGEGREIERKIDEKTNRRKKERERERERGNINKRNRVMRIKRIKKKIQMSRQTGKRRRGKTNKNKE